MNPILDKKYFIPDAEAHVMPDGKLYIYGSMDILGVDEYCSREYRVFSCDNKELENWTHHGISFSNYGEKSGAYWAKDGLLFAPDAIHKNGKYYLYMCGAGGFEGVAVSDKPEGPFTDARLMVNVEDSIDPAIFIDDDGSAYYYYGQFVLRGGKLKDDMRTLDESTINKSIITEEEHGFHEGASVRKINGKYYLVYTDISRGKATCLGYAMSDYPLGPYKKCGIIIDNTYCDPSSWNNHGSIECFKDQWYVFYHRTTQNSINTRRVCAEPIFLNEDGTINEVEMTTNGASRPLNVYRPIDASAACRMHGGLYIKTTITEEAVTEVLTNCGEGKWKPAWAEYKYLDFSSGVSTCEITIKGNGVITLSTEDSQKCGICAVGSSAFKSYTFDVSNLTGVKPIWFSFTGEGIEFMSFSFA